VKVGVLVFPGSNCDHDAYHVVKHVCGQQATFVWHGETALPALDAVIVPGGFSYGDYLRTGAIARFAKVMPAVVAFARQGGPVLGICNGFQILQEAGLLPGAMLRNRDTRFLSQAVHVRVESTDTPVTNGLGAGDVLNFYLPDDQLERLEGQGQVVFRYTTRDGRLDAPSNPNGSARAIAGVCNEARNVVGLMPHPERASEPELGSRDGRKLFEALLRSAVSA
jgi:phosphoribosylformylglycinamidine synthase